VELIEELAKRGIKVRDRVKEDHRVA
jgi:hypothetical protein